MGRRLAVQDASTLIDLLNGELLAAWCRLEVQTLVSDFVLEEIREPGQRRIVDTLVAAGDLEVCSTTPGGISVLAQMSRQHGISLQDASALHLAQTRTAILLCGDRRMRMKAAELAIPACGVLWICDMLVWHGVLPVSHAPTVLDQIRKGGAYLPAPECSRRISAWGLGEKLRPRDPWQQ